MPRLTTPEQKWWTTYVDAARATAARAGLTVNQMLALLLGITQVESSGGTNPAAQWQLGYNFGGTRQAIAHGLKERDMPQQIWGAARTVANLIHEKGSVALGLQAYGPGGPQYATDVLSEAKKRGGDFPPLGPTVQQTIEELLKETHGVAMQCVAFVNKYLALEKLPLIQGNASATQFLKGFHPAGAGGAPQIGDVVELNTGDIFGHVGIFEGFKGKMVEILGANQGNGWNLGKGLPPNEVLFPRSEITGWLPIKGARGAASSASSKAPKWPLLLLGAGALIVLVEAAG